MVFVVGYNLPQVRRPGPSFQPLVQPAVHSLNSGCGRTAAPTTLTRNASLGISLPIMSTRVAAIGTSLSLATAAVYFLFKWTRKFAAPKSSPNQRPTLEDTLSVDGSLAVQPIGVVRSVYRLCVGTPRQGLLAPAARGRVELNDVRYKDAVDGLEGFSHVWIVFLFHLNTQGKSTPFKIAPPALGGKRVGVLATRSPHRFNPIGMTLAKLDSIESFKTKKNKLSTVLHISGLDLVDGTPVLDIKPYVPLYDSIPSSDCHLPGWVSDGLATFRTVTFTPTASQELKDILQKEHALDFYDSIETVQPAIEQVLAMDVRSKFQTTKARQGQSRAEQSRRLLASSNNKARNCTQQLDNLLIHYSVAQEPEAVRSESAGSGAEDAVTVHSIELIRKKR